MRSVVLMRQNGDLKKRVTEYPKHSELPLCEDDLDIAIGASGMTSTTSATSSEQNRTPVVQKTLLTLGQSSEIITPLPESAMARHYPSLNERKPSGRY